MAAAEKLWGLLFCHPKVVEDVLSMSRLPKHARRTKSCRFLTCFVHPVDLIFFQLLVTWSSRAPAPLLVPCSNVRLELGSQSLLTMSQLPGTATLRCWTPSSGCGSSVVRTAPRKIKQHVVVHIFPWHIG